MRPVPMVRSEDTWNENRNLEIANTNTDIVGASFARPLI
jgi:hypothetical protein